MKVLIAGGGVGGLTLALSLRQRGIDCTVLEAAPESRDLGVGINLLPHALAELADLGMQPALEDIAVRTRTMWYLTPRGQLVWSQDCGRWAGHPVPQLSIHRGWLRRELCREMVRRAGADSVLFSRRVQDISQDADGVTVRFRDGGEITGDCLIGADGIHSRVREWLHPDGGGVRWNGIQMWRGATEWPAFEGGDTMVIAGGMDEKLVLYPISSGSTADTRLTNWAVCIRLADPDTPPPRREDWSRPGQLAEVLPELSRFELPFLDLEALVRATPEFFEFPMCDRDPLPWWTRGRVTLLGDAAHPVYPTGSNGAAQAILDARCLAGLLAERPAQQALADYEQQRLARTSEIVRANRAGGPERMIDLVTERAPDGFDRLEDVVSQEELQAIATGYTSLTTTSSS